MHLSTFPFTSPLSHLKFGEPCSVFSFEPLAIESTLRELGNSVFLYFVEVTRDIHPLFARNMSNKSLEDPGID